jgi:hypothetical protein
MAPQVVRTGVLASLIAATSDQLTVGIDWFAELDSGARVSTSSAHGPSIRMTTDRSGLNAIVRRHRGAGPPEEHRFGIDDIQDWAREKGGLLSLAEARANWASTWIFVARGGINQYLRQRRGRWHNLMLALKSEGISATRRDLDHVPFGVELSPELQRELG